MYLDMYVHYMLHVGPWTLYSKRFLTRTVVLSFWLSAMVPPPLASWRHCCRSLVRASRDICESFGRSDSSR
jgi:hypothetical protein